MHESERAALRLLFFVLLVTVWTLAALMAFSLER
jgi:hypothetical protein